RLPRRGRERAVVGDDARASAQPLHSRARESHARARGNRSLRGGRRVLPARSRRRSRHRAVLPGPDALLRAARSPQRGGRSVSSPEADSLGLARAQAFTWHREALPDPAPRPAFLTPRGALSGPAPADRNVLMCKVTRTGLRLNKG